jgi:RimK family alpha-L-glutamate ligase
VKKGLILTNPYFDTEGVRRQAERLRAELARLGASVGVRKNAAHLNAGVLPPLCRGYADAAAAEDCDFVVFLDKDKYTPRLLERRGVRVFNSAAVIETCDDKMSTYIALSERGIAMPETVAAPLCYAPGMSFGGGGNGGGEDAFYEYVAAALGFPLVVKECKGSQGSGVYLAENAEELRVLGGRLRLKPHLFQRFIAAGAGRDVRVTVIGGRAEAWMLRRSAGDFRSNIEHGGKGYAIDLPADFRAAAEEAAAALRADYCGVDLLYGGHGEPVLCEVNSNAFFETLEQITAKNIAAAYARHILSALRSDGSGQSAC